MIAARSDEDLLKDWKILDQKQTSEYVVTVRGLYLDEMEKRWPRAFDQWLESCDPEKGIEDFMQYEVPNYEE